jgi:AAA family ATP:ADP antiporter
MALSLSHIPFNPNIPFGATAWDQSLNLILSTVLCCGLLTVVIFRWFNQKVLTDPRYFDPSDFHDTQAAHKKSKPKTSFTDDLKLLLCSPYLLAIAAIVMAFGFVITSVEVLWKDQVRKLYPNPREYSIYMNQVMMLIGLMATFTALFISSNLLRIWGWTTSALIPPFILLLTSVGFFSFLLFPQYLGSLTDLFGYTPLMLTVFFGTAQNCLSRAAKYTLFDATKELAFIPLSRETKLKGKAAIDGIGSRLGKSGSSVLYTLLLTAFGSLSACTPYIALCLFACIVLWILAVKHVGHHFHDMTSGTASPPPPAPPPNKEEGDKAAHTGDSTSVLNLAIDSGATK